MKILPRVKICLLPKELGIWKWEPNWVNQQRMKDIKGKSFTRTRNSFNPNHHNLCNRLSLTGTTPGKWAHPDVPWDSQQGNWWSAQKLKIHYANELYNRELSRIVSVNIPLYPVYRRTYKTQLMTRLKRLLPKSHYWDVLHSYIDNTFLRLWQYWLLCENVFLTYPVLRSTS